MATEFTAGSFLGRWLFAVALVFGTYNPSGYSYISWVLAEQTEVGPVVAITGLVLLIAWIIYLRATFSFYGLARRHTGHSFICQHHLVAGGYRLAKP